MVRKTRNQKRNTATKKQRGGLNTPLLYGTKPPQPGNIKSYLPLENQPWSPSNSSKTRSRTISNLNIGSPSLQPTKNPQESIPELKNNPSNNTWSNNSNTENKSPSTVRKLINFFQGKNTRKNTNTNKKGGNPNVQINTSHIIRTNSKKRLEELMGISKK